MSGIFKEQKDRIAKLERMVTIQGLMLKAIQPRLALYFGDRGRHAVAIVIRKNVEPAAHRPATYELMIFHPGWAGGIYHVTDAQEFILNPVQPEEDQPREGKFEFLMPGEYIDEIDEYIAAEGASEDASSKTPTKAA